MPDRLNERFERFAEDVRMRPPRPGEVVRARGDRRRQREATIAVIAAVITIVLVGSLVGTSLARRKGALPPMSTPVPTAFPAGFRMPHEGEPGWGRSDDPAVPDGFTSCDGTDVTAANRVAAVTTTGPIAVPPTGRLTQQVLLYDSVVSAQTALASMYDATIVCHWQGSGIGQDPTYGVPVLDTTSQSSDRMAVGQTLLWQNALIVTYAVMATNSPVKPDVGGAHQIAERLCATMHLCETPKCVELGTSQNRPILNGCSPSPPSFGTITFTLQPLPDPTSADPGGISSPPGPNMNPAPTSR